MDSLGLFPFSGKTVMTETITSTLIVVTQPYSVYTYTLDSGQVLTVQNTATTGDLLVAGLLLAATSIMVLQLITRLVHR